LGLGEIGGVKSVCYVVVVYEGERRERVKIGLLVLEIYRGIVVGGRMICN
jgi:hypothetical protein